MAASARPPAAPAAPLLLTVLLAFACVAAAQGLRCIRCGEYTDGVGSITPCLNYTESQHLKDCEADAHFCVKYVTEASIVRDCVPECQEKEAWGTKIYCCSEDGCNGAEWTRSRLATPILLLLLAAAPPLLASALW